jgi:6-phosphogluconolactonase (cycloisomerase 2 family)
LPLIVSGLLQELRLDASGRFAYAAARDVLAPGDGWLLTFALDAGGVPALVDSRPAGLGSCAVALDVTGEFAFVGNQGDGTPGSAGIAVFRLDPRTGLPSAGGTPAPAPGVSKLALHPDGRTLYAVLSGSNALGRYTLDRVDAELTPAPPAQAPGLEPSALVLDARGRLAYAAYLEGASDGAVDVFAVAADAGLGSPLQEAVDGRDPVALALDPTGRFLYAANVASNDVSVFAIDAETGLLAARTPALAGLAPVAVTASGARR